MRPLRELFNKRRFDREKRRADQAGLMLCGTVLPGGKPVYFTMPADANDWDVSQRAFELREGRAITPGERTLMEMAVRRAGAA